MNARKRVDRQALRQAQGPEQRRGADHPEPRRGADLHTHSHYSDGTHSPAELVGLAQQLQLGGLALTDHDTVAGLAEAHEEARRLHFPFIPGIELTANHGGGERHVLGYWLDPDHPELVALLGRMAWEREQRIYRILEKLRQCAIDLDPQAVLATSHRGVLGRMHVAEALRRTGLTGSLQEGFDRYLRDDGPAYVQKYALGVVETCALIHRAGGLTVLAHPGEEPNEGEIASFAQAGLDGLEAFYPGYPPSLSERYYALARRLDLVVTGGSDFHGERKPQQLGEVTASPDMVEKAYLRLSQQVPGPALPGLGGRTHSGGGSSAS